MALTTTTDYPFLKGLSDGRYFHAVAAFESFGTYKEDDTHELDCIQRMSEAYRALQA